MPNLSGVVVADLSQLLPGPMCTWLLHGLGARVVKVENPDGGDPLRHMPPNDAAGVGLWFRAINGGKESVTIDLKAHPEQLLSLVEGVDVLVEGFRPGVLARLGLSPESLLERFPRLVICSISGYGQTGPWRDRPGHDLGYVSMTGVMAGQDHPLPVPIADLYGGAQAAGMSILAALLARERTGRGQWLDVSITDQTLGLVATALPCLGVPGAEVTMRALTGALPFYELYRCSDDRRVAVAALEPKFQAVIREGLGVDPTDRAALRAALSQRPRDHWAEALAHGCVTPVLELSEVADHPLHQSRGLVVHHDDHVFVLPPLAGSQVRAVLPAPGLGEHTHAWLSPSDKQP